MNQVLTAANRTPADEIKFMQDLIRMGKYLPMGRMQKIAIAPSHDWTPPAGDPQIDKYGRLIDLRERVLPIAQSLDHSTVLVTSPLLDRGGYVSLPDVPDPNWKKPLYSKEEVTGEVPRDTAKETAPMIPQRLEDRACGRVTGTNLLVFQPVISVSFQPEIEKRMVPTAWLLKFKRAPDGTEPALLVDAKTGWCYFYGGLFDIDTERSG